MTRELVIELAKPAVAAVAPDEAPVFDSVAQARLTTSGQVRKARRRGHDVLGSGLEVVVETITDGSLYIASAMVGVATERVVVSAGKRVSRWIRKLRGKGGPGPVTLDDLAAKVDERDLEIMRLRGLLAGAEAGLTREQSEALVTAMLTEVRARTDR
ncbi:hypothetical protein [Actinokineospora diospyrosa]|uniref:Uncharacterized protein n=1 Tax=Actinokineospora diospyrosa TaxID=103728 RepID=A0ABT1IES3_9PSEU|nr:hypothetical protein [Actinokineospora diospyrosa]MCP2271054.1 hypothetical protein [Actinokineospora diospyrosa]